ncbi:hypothetical protein [Spirosoma validum]|uniref:Uncharacterized protein n=1 Tax=Spirosoma validum TaxID=2771355 RepID=A0A927GFD4_9BACT|nr:hypothetical protein [Spirosoma validum]MBD2755724.1 hypothetical protein [Spirosoma validum]
MQSQNTLNKLSRRNWLRNAAIGATGAVMMPSLLTSCTDHVFPEPGGGLGSATPLTEAELRSAAQNLLHMDAWLSDVYSETGKYEEIVFHLLNSGQKPTQWKDFIINILTAIALGMFEAAGAITGTKFLLVGPELAIVSAIVRQFTSFDRPSNLEAQFAEFELGHLAMQIAISDKLLTLADETDNYKNLRDAWPGDLEFNGQKYTLKHLADSAFPSEKQGTDYVALRTAAYNQFRKHIWNVMIMKAGNINYYHWGNVTPYDLGQQGGCVHSWAMNRFYSDQPYAGGYLRGYYREGFFEGYSMEYWLIDFDGKYLSEDAAKELFTDYTPGQFINPDPNDKTKPLTGLFPRDYVFKQFNTTKTQFFGYFDLAKPEVAQCMGSLAFDESTYNYDYTGGNFPMLIKK